MEPDVQYLSLSEVASILGVTYHTIYRWVVKDKLLKGMQLGNKIWRISNLEVETYIQRRLEECR